jgi:16S rRNA (guanine1207-N2)-methyltransferase
MMINLAAGKVSEGSSIWVIGLPEEGIEGTSTSKSFAPLFAKRKETFNSDVVILHGVRSSVSICKPTVKEWVSTTDIELEGIPLRKWYTAPGLFAGGLVDVMTASLLSVLPELPAGSRVFDFGCGSGIISAALLQRTKSLRVVMADCDIIALDVAKLNVPDAEGHYQVSGWPECSSRFHAIVSNPPYHYGQPDSFAVVRSLIDGAASRLKRGGTLYIVSQEQIPIGRLFACSKTNYQSVSVIYTPDPRFVVWKAVTSDKRKRTLNPVSEKHSKRINN